MSNLFDMVSVPDTRPSPPDKADKRPPVFRFRRYVRVLKTEVRVGESLRPLRRLSGPPALGALLEDFDQGLEPEIPAGAPCGCALSFSCISHRDWETGVVDDWEWSGCVDESVEALAPVPNVPRVLFRPPEGPLPLVRASVEFLGRNRAYRVGDEIRFELVLRPFQPSRFARQLLERFYVDAKAGKGWRLAWFDECMSPRILTGIPGGDGWTFWKTDRMAQGGE